MSKKGDKMDKNSKEEMMMKKMKVFLMKHMNGASALAGFALVFGIIAANSRCYYIYHEPKAPEELKKLRRF